MKKLLVSLAVICAVLLSGIYLVGQQTQSELQKIFAHSERQGEVAKLLSYEKQFLKATAVSEVTLTAEGEKPVVFVVTSHITHYPYKAVINNEIRLSDQQLSEKARNYFGRDDWISSTEEINLLGQLTGKLVLLSGGYEDLDEQFITKELDVDYQVNLQNYSGSVEVNWGGLDMQGANLNAMIGAFKLKTDFAHLAAINEYNYAANIAKVTIEQKGEDAQLQDITLLGSRRQGEKANTFDSSNEWRVASYLVNNGTEKEFTDNYLRFDLKGLHLPTLSHLNDVSDNPELLVQVLTELMAHGGQLSLQKLSSQTPWGEVNAEMNVLLQEGSYLPAIIDNPFMLLDYISGHANLFLPDALLQLPNLSGFLQVGLQSGLLKREEQVLSLQMQLEQGELTVNERVIPL